MARIAVVDIGTNSTRLLVAEVDGGRVEELERRTTVTGLGQGVEATGRLADEAIARVSEALGAYETALDRVGEAARHVDVLVPGHGTVAEGPEVAARVAADRAYIDALRRGEEPVDARLGPDAEWLSGPHQSNLEQARGR
jgi:hypothetical protein